ncbi:uncharacterized protein BP01DRAFT_187790 [Aspergillus saccharolyticus JOP 1030-1]|uniref:Uncharacterized protein n=1 Tax=Aspergillus saccharolyticus JOP 1030-1 TaxID=1450539 RepID=A0A318Z294_9EURO|nr:hypothetical protein BP01DRAFT_187790 [Aspergillus saccharolyticus JOP 1030-1]PYH41059.1 hypothetical protein BP01DRAFT_187790 [Aspergillus saccharolyticus JOP 1030-1]
MIKCRSRVSHRILHQKKINKKISSGNATPHWVIKKKIDHIPAVEEHHTPVQKPHLQGYTKAFQAMNSMDEPRTNDKRTRTMHQENTTDATCYVHPSNRIGPILSASPDQRQTSRTPER